nr:MAG TPA: hypothetical protein [Caudoviricetes sp.]
MLYRNKKLDRDSFYLSLSPDYKYNLYPEYYYLRSQLSVT